MKQKLSLGLDLSTQSLTAVVLDIDSASKVCDLSLDYVRDPRLNTFGIREADYILPPREPGEADQPVELYLAALDALFADLKAAGVPPGDIAVIDVSGQQHGHVYLNSEAAKIFSRLDESGAEDSSLVPLLAGCFAYPSAPVWMTSNTSPQAAHIRQAAGGKKRVIELSGSDSPLRFTGAIVRRVAERRPDAYRRTARIQLLSSLIPAVLTGSPDVPADHGNASGMSLMDYTRREWSPELIRAVAEDLPGGGKALREKLPGLVPPYEAVGTVAAYFCVRYGFSPDCRVIAGSGDNPQSKVLVDGDLLSLGTSFVNMVLSEVETRDLNGWANAMYDGLGRPFMFGCRTNGALVWDRLRQMYGMEKDDYAPAEEALRSTPPGDSLVFWQPMNESFPPSASFDLVRCGEGPTDFAADYAGLVGSSIASVWYHSSGFTVHSDSPLFITGGPAGSREVLRRVAAIWDRPVVPVEMGGAALGAAVAGTYAYYRSEGIEMDVPGFCRALLPQGETVLPRQLDVAALHAPGGWLERFAVEEARLLAAHPPGGV